MKQQITETALGYLFKGYSIIPVGPNKIPLFAWKEFQTRKATPEEIVGWWKQYPDAQIGIVTGQISGITVIDVEADGDFNMIKDETFTVKTGGGGKHYYFKYEPSIKNSVRVLPLTDTRGDGGYVIASGSISKKGPYTTEKDIALVKMSESTLRLFKQKPDASESILPWYVNHGQSAYPNVSHEGLEYSGSGEGSRNDSMAKYAGSIHAKLHPSLWDSIGWNMFEEANRKNTPVLPEYEIRNIWKSIGSKELLANPGGRDYSQGNSSNKTWGPEPEKTDPVDAEINSQQIKEIEEQEQVAEGDEPAVDSKETKHVSEVAKLQVIDSDHTYSTDMPPFDEALLGGFSAGELIVVAGQSGHGKTTLIQDWSVTLSSGGKAEGEKLPSLWFSYEVLASPLWDKFKTMGATADTPIYMPCFNETGDINWVIDVIERAIVKWGIKVVCIDHLGFLRAPKGNYSNSADAITHTVRALKQLAVKHGLIILLPVHMRKTNSKNPTLEDIKDSSGIAQEADTVFFIGREKDDFGLSTNQARLWLVKNRKTGIAVSATFDFQFGRYYYDVDKDKKDKSHDSDAITALKSFDDWNK